MHSLSQLRALLADHGLSPRKSLGQCFLIDANLGRRLIDRSGAGAGDRVLEVGPGAGALTEDLLERGCEVVACEVDAGLCELLRLRFAGAIQAGALRLIHSDCLDRAGALAASVRDALGDKPYRLVANLPYAAGTPLLMTLLINEPRCASMCVTVQREVAERLRAAPGGKSYGVISVVAQALARLERIATLPPQCFWPAPKVESEMLALERLEAPLTDDPRALADIARRLFSKRRKQIGAILGRDATLPEGVAATDRPERLTPAQFVELARRLRSTAC